MIRKLEEGWCWIHTDDEPSNAVVWKTCVNGSFTPYSDRENGCEKSEADAIVKLNKARGF